MTELEKIKLAKEYLDKLASGIDPLSGAPLAESDIANNVRIARCFFYVSDVLRRVIENGGVTAAAPKPAKKRPFELSVEKRAAFRPSVEPIHLTELTKRINELAADGEMKQLASTVIRDWLVEIGLLRLEQYPDGRKSVPTDAGRDMGLFLEERTSQNRTYQVLLYTADMQQFVVDNLDAALELKRAGK